MVRPVPQLIEGKVGRRTAVVIIGWPNGMSLLECIASFYTCLMSSSPCLIQGRTRYCGPLPKWEFAGSGRQSVWQAIALEHSE